ncbi:hypothetical protein ADUPG1_010550, partial [Aduncisulcus paluster]
MGSKRTSTLFVSQLPDDATPNDIVAAIGVSIKDIILFPTQRNNFAFVSFMNSDNARTVLENCRKTPLRILSRTVFVKPYSPSKNCIDSIVCLVPVPKHITKAHIEEKMKSLGVENVVMVCFGLRHVKFVPDQYLHQIPDMRTHLVDSHFLRYAYVKLEHRSFVSSCLSAIRDESLFSANILKIEYREWVLDEHLVHLERAETYGSKSHRGTRQDRGRFSSHQSGYRGDQNYTETSATMSYFSQIPMKPAPMYSGPLFQQAPPPSASSQPLVFPNSSSSASSDPSASTTSSSTFSSASSTASSSSVVSASSSSPANSSTPLATGSVPQLQYQFSYPAYLQYGTQVQGSSGGVQYVPHVFYQCYPPVSVHPSTPIDSKQQNPSQQLEEQTQSQVHGPQQGEQTAAMSEEMSEVTTAQDSIAPSKENAVEYSKDVTQSDHVAKDSSSSSLSSSSSSSCKQHRHRHRHSHSHSHSHDDASEGKDLSGHSHRHKKGSHVKRRKVHKEGRVSKREASAQSLYSSDSTII